MDNSDRRRKRFIGWPAAFIILAVIVAICYLMTLYMPWFVLRGAFKRNVSISTVLTGSIRELRRTAKLVVCTATVDAEVMKSSSKTATIWGKTFDLGTTEVRLVARENKLQFYVPLARLDEGEARACFSYDHNSQTLIAALPAPRVDEEVVEVQSDPAKIEYWTKVGWARLDRRSGKFLREEARKDLRPAVINQGKQEILTDAVKQKSQEVVAAILEKHLRPYLAGGTRIVIRFQ